MTDHLFARAADPHASGNGPASDPAPATGSEASTAHTASHYWSNGTEHLDWQEVWCFRCKHDHDMSHGGDGGDLGCPILLKALIGEPLPEISEAGYTIVYHDGEHEVPNVSNSLPAAAFCSQFELCEPACQVHVNGARIVGLRKTTEGWQP
jgi:hypothetical protein